MNVQKFTRNELLLSILKIAQENNALLRLNVSHNVAIMKKLGIDDFEIEPGVVADLNPEGNQNPGDVVANLISTSEPISGMIGLKTWQWAKMNTGDHIVGEEDE